MGLKLQEALCLSLSLLVAITAPAGAQSRPSGTPTPIAVDPDVNKHEFNRGESIYAAPDSDKLLKYTIIKTNAAAMQELADLVVQFKALKDAEDKGRFDRAKTRELAMLKVKFYDKYNLGSALLKVTKAKMPEYIAFWPSFWSRVDQFRKDNPNITNPGPFTLPPVGKLAALREGGKDLLMNVAQVFAAREAAAADIYREGKGYPECNETHYSYETPLLKCNPYDEDRFYFKRMTYKNFTYKYAGEVRAEGPVTWRADSYKDDYRCVMNKLNGRMELQGYLSRSDTEEMTLCGAKAGDNAGAWTRQVKWYYDPNNKENLVWHYKYCADSKSEAFKRYQEAYHQITRPTEEPDWICK